MKDFDRFGIMLDCSRNGVRTVSALHRLIRLISRMGYNTLMLYIEDTYEINGQPYFGYMRGRYSTDELREIDRFAAAHGIEVIPCIQTLAHLNGIVNWPVYTDYVDCNDILLAGDERTYRLIDDMFSALERSFTSRIVNIGLDEAHMVGLGRYLEKNGYQNRYEIFMRHLERVREIAGAHGFRILMWSDMFFRFHNHGGYQMENPLVPDELPKTVPQDVGLIYWDYYDWGRNDAHYNDMFRAHSKFSNEIWYAGGAWTWSGFSPRNYLSEKVTGIALPLCRKYGVRNVVMTMWGDDGCTCSVFAALPALFYAAELARGNTDMELIKKRFQALFDIPYDAFKLLDLPGMVGGDNGWLKNPEKYMLFSDLFLGMYDSTVVPGDGVRYAEFSKAMEPWTAHPEWGRLFAAEKALCDVLARKYELGLKLRGAYSGKDRAGLERCAALCRETAELVLRFCECFRTQWMEENKAYGFETQELRLGGLALRLRSCAQRVDAYLRGELTQIEELEEPLLDYEGGGSVFAQKPVYQLLWRQIATPNLL